MKIFFCFSFLLFMSCAHQAPVTVAPVTYTNPQLDSGPVSSGMPNLFLDKNLLEKMRTGKIKNHRAPASVQEWEKSLEKDGQDESLKELYFGSLYHQYLKWQQLSPGLGPVKSCPQFHHQKLVAEETMGQEASYLKLEMAFPKDEKELPFYPLWALALKVKGQEKNAYEWSRLQESDASNLLAKAIKVHGKKLLREIKVLCEEGHSDGYFRLENIVTYFAQKKQFTDGSESLKSFLKIPVFSNMILLHSAEGQFYPSELSLLEKVEGWQIESYLLELKKQKTSGLSASVR